MLQTDYLYNCGTLQWEYYRLFEVKIKLVGLFAKVVVLAVAIVGSNMESKDLVLPVPTKKAKDYAIIF